MRKYMSVHRIPKISDDIYIKEKEKYGEGEEDTKSINIFYNKFP